MGDRNKRLRIQPCNTVIYIFYIRTTIWMLHTITKWLETWIHVNLEIREIDHHTWAFTSSIFRLALEITFLFNKYFLLQMACQLLWQSRKLNKRGIPNKSGGLEYFWKKISGGGGGVRLLGTREYFLLDGEVLQVVNNSVSSFLCFRSRPRYGQISFLKKNFFWAGVFLKDTVILLISPKYLVKFISIHTLLSKLQVGFHSKTSPR